MSNPGKIVKFHNTGNSKNTGKKANTGGAKPYNYVEGGPDSPNCYAYAIGEDHFLRLGEYSNTNIPICDLKSASTALINDMNAMGRSIRPLLGYDSEIRNNEYRIALRIGLQPYKEDDVPRYDYHFMVQTSSGHWAEKHGNTGDSIIHNSGMNPDIISWDLYDRGVCWSGYYDSRIEYYAISAY